MQNPERKYHLKQLIVKPTRVTNTVKSTIDLILTNMTMISESGVLDSMIPDHLPVYVVKKKSRNDKQFTYVFGRSLKGYNKDAFQNLVTTNILWRSFWLKTNDPNQLWDIMLAIIRNAADCICPIKRMKIRTKIPGWVGKEVVEAIVAKKDLLRQALHTGTELDWNSFREYKKYVRKLIIKSRQHAVLASLEENKADPRRFWRVINRDLGLNGKGAGGGMNFSKVKDENGNTLEGAEACTYMSNYYALNGVTLANKFNTNWTDQGFPTMLCDRNKFCFQFISMDIVRKLVKEIEISKSSGIENLNSRLIKDAFTVLIPELTHLFNDSIETGIFPLSWSIGSITPIPKDGDLLEPGNWRPITILPLPSKLLEKAIHYQVITYLNDNNILDTRQHGFRPGYSTSSAIFHLTKDLFRNYDLGNCTSCIFVDYRKAFETLDHDILCKKLTCYNFSENVVKWFQSYLADRKHAVCTTKFMSTPVEVKYGVPQGSTLGPLLFLLYVNDLLTSLKVHEGENVIMYADDTIMYASHSDPLLCLKGSQRLMDQLQNWCNINKLTINIGKTKHMFVPRKKEHEIQAMSKNVKVKNENLHNVKSYRYLGVDLDFTLSFEAMVDNMYNKANRKLYTLKVVRPYISNSVANLIYKSCVRPIMEYADFLIDSCTKAKTDKLDRIQKRAVRIIDRCHHKESTYEDLLLLYGLDELVARRKKHHLSLMYRQSKDMSNLETYRPDVVLRNSNKIKFKIKNTKLTMVQNSPFYRGVTLWDRLPEEVQKATTKVKFKQGLNLAE